MCLFLTQRTVQLQTVLTPHCISHELQLSTPNDIGVCQKSQFGNEYEKYPDTKSRPYEI
jgi:hypothetical protein